MSEQGKVLKSTGKWYTVEMSNGEIVKCRIRGRLRLDGLRTTNPIAVGDVVGCNVGDAVGDFVINELIELVFEYNVVVNLGTDNPPQT